MKNFNLILICVVLTQPILAQSITEWDKEIANLNYYLNIYSKVSPFNELYSMKAIGLTDEEIKLIREDKEYTLIPKDSINNFDLMYFLQWNIEKSLTKIVKMPSFLTNDIQSIIHEELSTVISPDKKLYNFSLDEKAGGTYRSRISWMYFTEIGYLSMSQFEEEAKQKEGHSNPYDIFTGDGFGLIDTVQTSKGVKYILTSWVRGCSYCFGTGVILADFTNDRFNLKFDYSISLRDWNTGVSYNPETKIITVEYETDDLTSYCNCEGEEIDGYPEFEREYCKCVFEFNGINFELVETHQKKIKD